MCLASRWIYQGRLICIIHPTFLAFLIEKEKEERVKEFFSFFLVQSLSGSNKLLLELLNNSGCELICHRYCMLVQCVRCSYIGSIVPCQSGNGFCFCKGQMFIQHVHHIILRPVWISRTQECGDLICIGIPLLFSLF